MDDNLRTVPLGIVVKDNEILLVNRRFPPKIWGPPGGFVEENEALTDAVEREVYEETGIICKAITEIHQFKAYDTHLIVYACKYLSGSLRCSYESLDIGWYGLDALPQPLSPELEILEKAVSALDTL